MLIGMTHIWMPLKMKSSFMKTFKKFRGGDKVWMSKVDKSIARAQKIINKAQKKEAVPATFKTAHKHTLRAGKEYQFIVDNTDEMLSEYDPELKLMQEVVNTIDEVHAEIENADNEVDRLVDEKQLKQ